jgi:probable rRNA maturation factor
VNVFLADEQGESVDLEQLKHLAELVLAEERYPDQTELTLLLVDDREMSAYNQRFLERDGPTDVLAFPVEELVPGLVPDHDPNGPPLLVGDVIIAPSYIRGQAADLDVEFDDEMALMVTHGILHLLGYDHQEDQEAVAMERRETEILALVGRERR